MPTMLSASQEKGAQPPYATGSLLLLPDGLDEAGAGNTGGRMRLT